MKLGIISDTHNNTGNTQHVLAILRERGVERLIHCGDVTTASTVALFAGRQINFVYGNVDGDAENRGELTSAVTQYISPGAIAVEYTAEIDGVPVAACHGDDKRRLTGLIQSGKYRYVFHGHTHRRRDEHIGPTRVINPGSLGGLKPQSRSFCMLDLATGEAEFVNLG